jgi:hypothetical protein
VPYQAPTKIAIIGRDRMVGQALELLLRGADYDARFLGEPVMDKPGELLDGVHVLLLGPTLNVERREYLLDGLRGEPRTANIPILELITITGESRNAHGGRHVMWPCKTEELIHHIEETLLSTGDRLSGSPTNNGRSRV